MFPIHASSPFLGGVVVNVAGQSYRLTCVQSKLRFWSTTYILSLTETKHRYLFSRLTIQSKLSFPFNIHIDTDDCSFFNTVWLILNDITLGVAFGSFICENSEVLARMMESAFEVYTRPSSSALFSRFIDQSILVVWIQWVLKWLDSWPAGLKLNTELSRVYSHTFIDLVSLWAGMSPFCLRPAC